MKRVMIDIEAWDLRETAIILSIGIVDLPAPGELSFYPNLFEQEKVGRTIGASTAQWWAFQSDDARFSTLHESIDRDNCCAVAMELLRTAEEVDEVWCSGPSYDFKIIRSFVETFGDGSKWPFWKERDLRTLKNVLDPDGKLAPTNPCLHNALEDARAQAVYLQKLLEKI